MLVSYSERCGRHKLLQKYTMEDEVEHPIIRNLYRQSSLETPLSPSIPSDSDSEDDDKKVEPAINQKLQVESVGNKLSRAPSPINELRNHYENVGIMKLKSDIKPERTLKDDSKPDDDYAIPNPVNKRKKIPAASQIQIPINTSLIEELRNRQVLGNSDKETKARVVGEQKKKPIPKPKPPSRSIFPEPTDGSPPLLPEKPRSGSSQTEIQTINPPLIDEVRDPNEKSGISNKTSTEAGLVTIPETLTENDNEPKANVDVSAESNADSVSTTIVQEVQEEGKYAIDSPGLAANPDMPPEDYTLDENEERSMMEPRALDDPKLQELIYVLIEWVNDELADQRIIVKDIAEDLYDGQVLQKLLERLTGEKLDVPEVTQSEEGQKQKLAVVLTAANRVLNRYPPYKWSVDSVHSKNIVSILHLLVGLARQFRAPVRLPERVAVQVVVVRKKDGQLIHRTIREEITSTYEDLGMRCERDAFDTLFDHAPEKLAVVKKSLVTFVNKHLSKVHLEVTELDTQFHDGVFLTLLLGLLEGFFVPLGSFHLTPKTHDQKVHNVSFAFDLMQEIGLVKPKARPEDIVNLDLKSTLRVLYNLFTKYKGMN